MLIAIVSSLLPAFSRGCGSLSSNIHIVKSFKARPGTKLEVNVNKSLSRDTFQYFKALLQAICCAPGVSITSLAHKSSCVVHDIGERDLMPLVGWSGETRSCPYHALVWVRQMAKVHRMA